jgi:hypothetical protein
MQKNMNSNSLKKIDRVLTVDYTKNAPSFLVATCIKIHIVCITYFTSALITGRKAVIIIEYPPSLFPYGKNPMAADQWVTLETVLPPALKRRVAARHNRANACSQAFFFSGFSCVQTKQQ